MIKHFQNQFLFYIVIIIIILVKSFFNNKVKIKLYKY